MKTVLITGSSSGIGKASVHYFSKNGWKVFASMRNTEDTAWCENLNNVIPLSLDVSDLSSIRSCLKSIIREGNTLNALINNAGYGGYGAFELSSPDQRLRMYQVNVFGMMNVIQEVLPHFRKEKSGLIINVSSIGGRMTYPLYSVYHSTKWAVEGFSESLYYELRQLGIQVKIVEPGATKTDFQNRSQVIFKNAEITDYDSYMERLYAKVEAAFYKAMLPEKVADTIFQAATDQTDQLRYPVGNKNSMLVLRLRKLLPLKIFMKMIRKNIES